MDGGEVLLWYTVGPINQAYVALSGFDPVPCIVVIVAYTAV